MAWSGALNIDKRAVYQAFLVTVIAISTAIKILLRTKCIKMTPIISSNDQFLTG
jgi:hypothetical protein